MGILSNLQRKDPAENSEYHGIEEFSPVLSKM